MTPEAWGIYGLVWLVIGVVIVCCAISLALDLAANVRVQRDTLEYLKIRYERDAVIAQDWLRLWRNVDARVHLLERRVAPAAAVSDWTTSSGGLGSTDVWGKPKEEQ